MKSKTKTETATAISANAADIKPWSVFAGTVIHNAHGVVVLCAHEEGEMCGGTFDSIRQGIAEAVLAVNEHAALCAIAETAEQVHRVLDQVVRLANVNAETRRIMSETGTALGKTLVSVARLRADI